MGENIYRIFDGVWNLSLVGGYCVLLVLLARLLLQKAPKWCSYLLWGIVFVRLCCPILPETGISLIPEKLLSVGTEMTSGQQTTGADHRDLTEGNAMKNNGDALWREHAAEEIPDSHAAEKTMAVGNDNTVMNADGTQDFPLGSERIESGATVAGVAASGTDAVISGTSAETGTDARAWIYPVWFRVLSLVWLAGMLGFLGYHAYSYLRMRHRIRRLDSGVRQVEPGICEIDGGHLSFVMGLIHPVIYLSSGLDPESRKVVLCHERVHLQRRDYLFKPAALVICCVHWFNPLVWAMYVLANRDLELSCDETVLRRFGGDVRGAYARVLIRMEERRRGVQPQCNYFSKNAMEERIRAIMKMKKITAISLTLAALLVTGTVTVFATSAKQDENIAPVRTAGAVVEQNAANAGGAEAVERGEPLQPSAEYAAAGIRAEGSLWYYQGQPVAMIYDDNGNIYMDEEAADGCYLNVRRDSAGGISGVDVLTKEQFRERADRQLNLVLTETTMDEETLMSYIDPADGKTYYSFDDGKTFEPLTDAEFEALYPTPDIEWWTYEEYKAWLDSEKVQLQEMLGQEGWTSGEGSFVWTQEKIDETIALYEEILADIQNGVMYSKTVDGQDDMMVSYSPADIAMSRDN